MSPSTLQALQQVKQAIRQPYAWPGGYAVHVIMSDGELLCTDCAKHNFRLIARATIDRDHSGWEAAGNYVHWEGPDETCAHCGRPLPSEYGIPESALQE